MSEQTELWSNTVAIWMENVGDCLLYYLSLINLLYLSLINLLYLSLINLLYLSLKLLL